ncbi:hypothetical protein CSUB01_06387 [Colletotrichum sublineola]|uniref:Uncharacterized protein n=1 Tax=Colletotrichum sublineola TaxID=1173701 RepID=A0A066X760_COLSU|nr:hypothetical protein CSUB01_06387 [Colletotrichum sublineola]
MIFVSVQGPHMPYSPFFFRVRVYTASWRSEIAGGPNSPKGGDAEPQVRWPPESWPAWPPDAQKYGFPGFRGDARQNVCELTNNRSNARAALSHAGTVAGRGLNFTSTYSEAAASESESPTVHRVSAPPTGTLAEAGTKHRRIVVGSIPRPEAKFSGQCALLMEPEVLCPSKVFVVPGFMYDRCDIPSIHKSHVPPCASLQKKRELKHRVQPRIQESTCTELMFTVRVGLLSDTPSVAPFGWYRKPVSPLED